MSTFNPQAFAEEFAGLFDRWQAEREYEDFEDYKRVCANALESTGAKLVEMGKRPFRMVYQLPSGEKKWMKATSREVTWGGYVKKPGEKA